MACRGILRLLDCGAFRGFHVQAHVVVAAVVADEKTDRPVISAPTDSNLCTVWVYPDLAAVTRHGIFFGANFLHKNLSASLIKAFFILSNGNNSGLTSSNPKHPERSSVGETVYSVSHMGCLVCKRLVIISAVTGLDFFGRRTLR